MKNQTLLFVCLIFTITNIQSQSIFSNPITGPDPNTYNPYIIGQIVNSNIAVSGIGRGLGITGTNSNDRYNATSWNTSDIDLTAYFEFTLTPNSGYAINFSSFVYTGQASGTGPTAFAFRSSGDFYGSDIGTPLANGATISLSSSSYQGITSAITFRLYGWGASASGGTFSVNNFTFNGTITSSCTAPTNQANNFSATNIQPNQMDINWVRGTPSGGDNVLVVARAGGAVNADPVNGTSYTANTAFGSGSQIGTGNFVVYKGLGTMETVTSLTSNSSYHYAIYEFNNTGLCYNLTQLTGNATTLASGSEIQIEYPIGSNASCGVSIPFGSVTIGSNSSRTVRIRNVGAENLILNSLPLTISGANSSDYSITTQPTSPITGGNYSDVIIQFTPTAGGTRSATIVISNNDNDEPSCSLVLTGTGLLPNDDCTGAIPLTVYATPTCGGATSGTTVGATSSGLSPIACSGFNGAADDDVWYSFQAISTKHTITIVPNSSFDAVVDLRSGACNGTYITCIDALAAGGTEVINVINLTIGDTYFIRVYSYGTGNNSNGTFTVCVTTPHTPSYFQTRQSGNWSNADTWEVSTVSSNGPWTTATAPPSLIDLNINIIFPHSVSISSGTTIIDQLEIASNSTLEITGGTLSINDGTGMDLKVFGILKNAGTITTTGTIAIENGGIYQHNHTTVYGTIPTATWNDGSSCEIIGYTNPAADGFPTGISQAFNNFTWNTPNLSSTPNLNGGTLNVSGTFFMISTGSSELRLGLSSNGMINANEFFQEGGTINCSTGSGAGKIKVTNNFNQAGGTINESGSGSGIIELTGASNITVLGTIQNTINFLINSPSNTISLLSNLSLTSPSFLTLTAGKLNLNGYELEVGSILGIPAWGGSTSSYIIAESGNLMRTIGTNTLFPVGTASQYMPCQLTGAGDFKVNISATTAGLTNSSLALPTQWNITDGSGSLGMDFQWPSNVFGTTTYLYKHDGSNWANVGGPVTATGGGPYTASFTNINCCSGFTVGGLAALPVELAYFRATPASGKVQLDWRTYSENNNAFFSIEKSTDGKAFIELGTVEGKGFATDINDYDFMDEFPATGNNYYRLKQVDFNGNFEYSKIVSVYFRDAKGGILLYPTISSNTINLRFPNPTEGAGTIHVFDYGGKLVMKHDLESETEEIIVPINELQNGAYFLKVLEGQTIETLRFFKQ